MLNKLNFTSWASRVEYFKRVFLFMCAIRVSFVHTWFTHTPSSKFIQCCLHLFIFFSFSFGHCIWQDASGFLTGRAKIFSCLHQKCWEKTREKLKNVTKPMSEVNQTRIQCKPVREVTKMCNLSAVWCIILLLTGMFSFFVAIFRYSAPHSCNGRTRVLTIKKKLCSPS